MPSGGFEAGKDVLIMPQKIERVVVEQRRGDIGRHAVEFPRDAIGAGEIPFRPGQADGQHRLMTQIREQFPPIRMLSTGKNQTTK